MEIYERRTQKHLEKIVADGSEDYWAWLILLIATFLVTFGIEALINNLPRNSSDWPPAILFIAIFSAIIATVSLGLWAFLCWLCHWRNFRRFLFGLACFVTLVALFYVEEDWRGKHDWEQFKHEWEAKGEQFGPASVVPPPVPDDQNFAMAPVFDTVDKLMDQKWCAQHRNPHQGKDGDQMEWDTNVVNRLEMTVSENGENPTNGLGNWQRSTVSDLKVWQQYYREPTGQNERIPHSVTAANTVAGRLAGLEPLRFDH